MDELIQFFKPYALYLFLGFVGVLILDLLFKKAQKLMLSNKETKNWFKKPNQLRKNTN